MVLYCYCYFDEIIYRMYEIIYIMMGFNNGFFFINNQNLIGKKFGRYLWFCVKYLKCFIM